jgi:hypothetical protein
MPRPFIALPTRDPAIVTRHYAPQFEASRELLDTIWRSVPAAGGNAFEYILMNLMGRSIGTYRALLHLLGGGYTAQAWMLNRSLFEDMVAAYWLALPQNRDTAVSLVQQRLDSTQARLDRIAEGAAETETERLTSLDNLIARLGKRVREIEPLWQRCGGKVDDLRATLEINWFSNLELHATGQSLLDTLYEGSIRLGKRRLYAYGQSSQVEESEMLTAFAFAAFQVGALTRLLLYETERPRDELDVCLERVAFAAGSGGPSERAKIGQNDPCWCGSGAKRKRCHPE